MRKATTHSGKAHRPPRTGAPPSATPPAQPPEESLSAVERQELQDLRDTVATLYAREALLDAVIQSLPIWITVKDATGRYLLVNQAMAEALGKTPDQFVDKLDRDILKSSKSELDALETLEQMVRVSGKPVERPSYLLTLPDGTEQVRRMIKLPLHDSDGATLGVIGWSEDITQRQEVEASLERNRRLLQTVFNTIPHPLSFTDYDRRLRMVNTAFCQSLRIRPEDIIGKTVMEIPTIPKRIRQALWDQTTEIYDKGQEEMAKEYVYPLPDGGMVVTQTSKAPIIVNNKLEGIVTLSVDVTEIRQASLSLAESRQLLQTLFEVMPHPLSYVDRTRKLRMVNRAWCAALAVQPEDVLGKTILEVEAIPEKVRQTLWDESTEIFKTGVVPPPVVHKIPARDGSVRYAQVGKSVVMVNGQVDGIVTLSTDITLIRLAEEQAQVAEQRMHDALESIPAAIYLYDAEDKLILANSMAKSRHPSLAQFMQPGTPFPVLMTEVAKILFTDPQDRAQFIDQRQREFRHIVRQVEQRGPNGEYLLGHDRRTTEGGTVSIRFDISEQKRIQQELEKRERETRAELTLAGQVQRNILQELKPRPFILEAHEFRPSSFVSGDIFHSGVAGDGSFLFFLGDATGHGVSAALITMLVKATLAAMPDNIPMHKMAEELNARLVEYSLDGMYMSGIFLRITPGGELSYCNAGHPAALVIGPGKDAKIESSGPPMGWFDVTGYESAALRLAAGDKVVLLTDGLTEWANAAGEQLGVATVERVARANADYSSQRVLDALLTAAKDHGVGEQGDDDLSIFVFEYRPRFG